MQHYRKCHSSQMDITGKITFRTTENTLVATCTSDILSPSSAPNLLVHFFMPKIKNNLTNFDVPCTMNCLNFIN